MEIQEPFNFKIFSLEELFNKQFPKENFLIDKLLPLNGISCLSGSPGCGKSWLLMEIARCVASGVNFGELKTIQGPVLIIDRENGSQELQRRMKKLGTSGDLSIYFISLNYLKVDDENSLDKLIIDMKRKGIKLAIFDPLISFHSVRENEAGGMQLVMEGFEKIVASGISVLFSHHNRKQTSIKDMAQSLRGSSAILGRLDSLIAVKKDKEYPQMVLTVIHAKSRRSRNNRPFAMNLIEEGEKIHFEFSKKEIQELSADSDKTRKEKILKAIKEAGMITLTGLVETFRREKKRGFGRSKINQALEELISEEKILFEMKARGQKIYSIHNQEKMF